jgi:probable rRNA maturation factor
MGACCRMLPARCCAGPEQGRQRLETEHLVSVVGDEAVPSALEAMIERAVRTTLQQQGITPRTEVTVALVSPGEMRQLNRTHRNIDEETDVLSFAMDQGAASALLPGALPYLGDIAISTQRAELQAREYGHSFAREIAYLTVHGVLHLLGHDHHAPDEQRRMRAAEEAVLALLGLPRADG